MDGEVLLADCIAGGLRVVPVEVSSPHTNLTLPRPSAACIILVWCAGICLLPFPSVKGIIQHSTHKDDKFTCPTHLGTICMYLS